MFIEFPDYDKLINVDSIDRIEIQTNHNGNGGGESHKMTMYLNHYNFNGNHRNNNGEIRKFVLMKSFDKSELYEVWRDIVEKMGDTVISISTSRRRR